MKVRSITQTVVCFLFLLTEILSAQSRISTASPQGSLSNGVYSNDFFGPIRMTIPSGWSVETPNTMLGVGNLTGQRRPLPANATAPELILDADLLLLKRTADAAKFEIQVVARSRVVYRSAVDLADEILRKEVSELAKMGIQAEGTDDHGTVTIGGKQVYYQGYRCATPRITIRERNYYFEFDSHYVVAILSSEPGRDFETLEREFGSMVGVVGGAPGLTLSGSPILPARLVNPRNDVEIAIRSFDSGQFEKNLPVLERYQNDDVRAACRVGLGWIEGRTETADSRKGYDLLRSAAERGDPLCQAEYGMRIYRGWGGTKDRLKGVALIEDSVRKDSARGKAYLASLHMNGWDVPLDCNRAKSLLDAAVAAGDPEGSTWLGVFYYTPVCAAVSGGANRPSMAVTATRRAQSQGSAMAEFNLGTFYHYGFGVAKDGRTAETLYKSAIAHGNPWAMNNLGAIRMKGLEGLAKDVNEGLALFAREAELGDSGGNRSLGEVYLLGEVIPRDPSKGLSYLQKAIDADDLGALTFAGGIYEEGKFGTPQDGMKALGFYRRACDMNSSYACLSGGAMLGRGKVIPKNPSIAVPMIEKAVNLGNARSLLWLGLFYENGEGKLQNFGEAMRLYQLAQSKGDTEAAARIRDLTRHMRNPQGWRGILGIPF